MPKSVARMLDQLEGLLDTKDLTRKENEFLREALETHAAGDQLSVERIEQLDQLYRMHFA